MHQPDKRCANVLALIVSYQPDITALQESIRAVSPQVGKVLLVDNASHNTAQIQQLLTELNTANQGQAAASIELHCVQDNVGLGAAHNIGIQFAQEQGFEYIVILDQDSIAHTSMIASLRAAHEQQSALAPVSAVGAHYQSSHSHSDAFFVRTGRWKLQRVFCDAQEDIIEVDFLISSGSLMSLEDIARIGGMDEGLFIDHIDSEWFLRANSMGYKAFGVCAAKMQHGLGESVHKVRLFNGRTRYVPQHKPFRYYYTFRNSVLLYKRAYPSWQWKWNDAQRLLMIFIMFAIVKAPRWANSKMMLKGIWHGVIGKTGKLMQN